MICSTIEKFHFSFLLKFNSSLKMHSTVCLACEMKDLLNVYKFLWKFVSFDCATLSLVVASQVCTGRAAHRGSWEVLHPCLLIPMSVPIPQHRAGLTPSLFSPLPTPRREHPWCAWCWWCRLLGKPCSWKQSAARLGPSAKQIRKYLSTMHPFLNHVLRFDNFIEFHFNESLIKVFFS